MLCGLVTRIGHFSNRFLADLWMVAELKYPSEQVHLFQALSLTWISQQNSPYGRKQRESGSKVPRQASYSKTTSGPGSNYPSD